MPTTARNARVEAPYHLVPNQIVAQETDGTPAELRARGRRALLEGQWANAAAAFEALLAGDPESQRDPDLWWGLAVAHEGLNHEREARDRYRVVAERFPGYGEASLALGREIALDVHLEDWTDFATAGDALLARPNLAPTERILGLGARALSRVRAGDTQGASHDIHEGLDLVDETRLGATGRLPVAVAMLTFAHGELRKLRSESIALEPPGTDFVLRLETRCQALLDAQAAYADAIRSVDPYWAAMSGFRIGEMYRTLHQALMRIPSTGFAKTDRDRELFFGIMHVRYRTLLEKGMDMMKRTLDFAARTETGGLWVERAEQAKRDMDATLEEETRVIGSLAYTESELKKALAIMAEHARASQAKRLGE